MQNSVVMTCHFTSLNLQSEPYSFELYFSYSNYRLAQCLVENTLKVMVFDMTMPSMSRKDVLPFCEIQNKKRLGVSMELGCTLQVQVIEDLPKKIKDW